MDDFDLAFSADEGSGQSGQAAGTPAPQPEGKPTDTPSEAAPQEDKAAPTGEQAKPPEAVADVLPKELEPYKGILDSRKWNPKNPDFAPTVLKSYQEAEAYAKRREAENNLLRSSRDTVAAKMRGDAESINQYRKQQGLPPIRIERPLEERTKETEALIESVNRVLSNPNDAEAFRNLDALFSKSREALIIERAQAANQQAASPEAAFEARKSKATTVFGGEVARNPEIATHIDALSTFFGPGSLFDSLGIDELTVAETPAHLAKFAELGQAMHVYKNLEKIVEERVKSELERRRGATVSAGHGQQPKGGAPKATASDLSPVELAFMS
jgi:hypothetical protein